MDGPVMAKPGEPLPQLAPRHSEEAQKVPRGYVNPPPQSQRWQPSRRRGPVTGAPADADQLARRLNRQHGRKLSRPFRLPLRQSLSFPCCPFSRRPTAQLFAGELPSLPCPCRRRGRHPSLAIAAVPPARVAPALHHVHQALVLGAAPGVEDHAVLAEE